jgi:para-nitrobenzyl esterase
MQRCRAALHEDPTMSRRTSGIVALLCAAFAVAPALAAPAVTVDGVTIEGTVSTIKPSVNVYYGIPYAFAERWRPPHDPAPLANPFDASNVDHVAVCPQPDTIAIHGVTLTQSEDCLSLNVFTPAYATPTSKLPVLFWIHGGGLQNGSGVIYDAASLVAANNIVVVTINYRLGELGWLAQRAVRARVANKFQATGDAGDYGLMDQQFAMRWAKRHIARFGGDPDRITIGGESAGGDSVLLNLASTTTGAGLFRAAVVASGAFHLHNLPSQATSETQYGDPFVDNVLAGTGVVDGITCANLTSSSPRHQVLACLRGASVATLISVQSAQFPTAVPPNYGTLIVPHALKRALADGDFNQVPVLQGTNRNEGRFFEPREVPFAAPMATIVAAGGPANYDLAHANAWCGGVACSYAQEINLFLAKLNVAAAQNTPGFDTQLATVVYPLANFPDRYLPSSAPSADAGLAQIQTDYQFACNADDANRDLAKRVTVFAYEFDDPDAPPAAAEPAVAAAPNDQYGYPTASEHASDLAFLFTVVQTAKLGTSELFLAQTIQSYVGNFVNNLDPSVGANVVPAWPAFNASQQVQALVVSPATPGPFTTFAADHFCRLWAPVIAAEAQQ